MNVIKPDIKNGIKAFLNKWDILVYGCAAIFFGLFYLADTPYESGFFQYMICQAVLCLGITLAITLKLRQQYEVIIPKIVYCWSCMVIVYIIAKLIKNIVQYVETDKFTNPLHFRTLLSMMGVLLWILVALIIRQMFAKCDKEDTLRFIATFRRVEMVFLIACLITLLDGFVFIRSVDLFGERQLSIIPFETIINLWKSSLTPFQLFCQYAGNLLLFFPFGFAAKSRDLDKANSKAVRNMFCLIPVLLTLAIELSQFILNTGWCDIDDVILNIVGYYIGAVVVVLCNRLRAAVTKGQDKNIFII